MSIEEMYAELKRTVTADHLKDLTVQLIDAYKARNTRTLERYAQHAFGPQPSGERPANELFFRLIKHFHPDRLNSILRDVDEAFRRRDQERLQFFQNLMNVRKHVRPHRERVERPDVPEEYAFGREDFGYDTTAYSEGVFSDAEDDEEFYNERETEFDFISAVKAEHLGNLDIEITAADLQYLEGELILAGYELTDLDGLEQCVNITVLDLSDNRIDNIYEVQFLHHLQELFVAHNHITDIDILRELRSLEILDLSSNEVENISVLLDLEALKFVNLSGNPILDTATIRELERRSVVVLF